MQEEAAGTEEEKQNEQDGAESGEGRNGHCWRSFGEAARQGVGKNRDIARNEMSVNWMEQHTRRNHGRRSLHPIESRDIFLLQWHVGMPALSEAAKAFQEWQCRA